MIRIENLKVPVYYYDILRKAKKNQINISVLFGENEDSDKSFKEFISNLISKTKLSVIYSNLTPDSFSQIIKTREFDVKDRNKKINTLTVAFISFGSEVENYISMQGEEEKKLSSVALNVYMKTTVNTVTDMISEEAKKENSEITEPYFIHSPFNFENNIVIDSEIEPILNELTVHKIGIKYENSTITPLYTALFFVCWSLKKKK